MTTKKDARGRVRNYRREYESYHASAEQRRNRSLRNKAARKKKCPDGQEVDHKQPLSKGGSNRASNLRCVSRRTNRQKGNKSQA